MTHSINSMPSKIIAINVFGMNEFPLNGKVEGEYVSLLVGTFYRVRPIIGARPRKVLRMSMV